MTDQPPEPPASTGHPSPSISLGPSWLTDPHHPAQLRYWDGSRWTEHVAPRLATPLATTPDRRTTRLAQASVWAAAAWTMLSFIQLPFVPGTASAAILGLVRPSEVLYYLLGALKPLAALAAYVVTCLWLWHCRRNVADLRPSAPQRHSPGWVWGSWLTPVLAWWFPQQVVRDIASAPDDSGTLARPPRLGWWWAAFLAMQAAGVAAAALHTSPASAELWFAADAIHAVLALTALALWVPIIRYIDHDQAALTEHPSRARRRVLEVLAASTAIALLATGLAFAATTEMPSRPHQSEPDGPRFEMPSIGDCHTLGSSQLDSATDEAAPAPCSEHHTSITYDVGLISGDIDDFDGGEACDGKRLDKAVGRDHRLTYAGWTSYVPTIEQEDHGARWFRCDVYVQRPQSDRLRGLPAGFPLIKDSTDSPFMTCTTDLSDSGRGGSVVPCSTDHVYEASAVATLTTGTRWPGDAKVSVQSYNACKAALEPHDRGDFLYVKPTREEWNQADEAIVVCYARSTTDGSSRRADPI
jgi:hypothetical protein